MKIKSLRTLLLAVCMAVFAFCLCFTGFGKISANASNATDDTTDYTGYYKIRNAGNLAWFACLVVGDTSQSGITQAEPNAKAVLTADIDITVLASLEKSWVGIGTEAIPFTGIFDGNGYTIKGLTTDTSLANSAVKTIPVDVTEQGLFGVIGEGGVVRNVVLEGTAELSDAIQYGGICSENNGAIENVLSKVIVTGGDNADVICHTNNGTITNAFAKSASSVLGVTVVDDVKLASGSVAYALGSAFGQAIGTDLQPVHYNDNNRVYYGYTCDETQSEKIYTNINAVGDEKPSHSIEADDDRAATCTTPAYCSACKKEYGAVNPENHAWEDGEVTTDPTCSAVGVKTYICTHNSAHTKTEDVAIIENAHAWNEGEVTTNPTCMEKGIKTYTCTHNSEHTYTEDVAIDENAHAWNDGEVTTDPTCSAVGTKKFTCTHNNAHTKTEDVAIDPENHSFGEWTVTKEATETETGSRQKTCICGHSLTEDIPMLEKDGLTGGAIVGIVVGSVAVVGIGGFALYWFVIKKKKR